LEFVTLFREFREVVVTPVSSERQRQ